MALALGIVLGLVSIGFANLPDLCGIRIVAPSGVPAGATIHGYCTGGLVPKFISASDSNGNNCPGSPVVGLIDPSWFHFLTFEPMAGSVVTIHANEPSGTCDVVAVAVW
jgi:hypothetical protein